MVSRFLDVSPSPKTYMIYLRRPEAIKKAHWNISKKSFVHISKFCKSKKNGNFRKDGCREIPPIRLIWFWNLVYEISIYQQTWNGNLANLWNQETTRIFSTKGIPNTPQHTDPLHFVGYFDWENTCGCVITNHSCPQDGGWCRAKNRYSWMMPHTNYV